MNGEKHTNLKIPLTMYEVRWLWADQGDKVRMEMLKSIIYTAPNMHDFYAKVMEELNSDKFQGEID